MEIAGLVGALELSLSPVGLQSEATEPVSALSNEEVVALAQLQMDTDLDQRLSRLLDKQQAGTLTEVERSFVVSLDAGLSRKPVTQSPGVT